MLEVIFFGDSQNFLVFLLDLLDISIFLETDDIFLLPLTHGFEPSLLELFKPESLGIVLAIELGLRVIFFSNNTLVLNTIFVELARKGVFHLK